MDDLYDLAEEAPKAATKAKAKGIVIEVDEVQEAHDNWVKAKREYADAKATMEQTEQVLVNHAEPRWRAACQSNGEVENSARLGTIRVTWKGKSQFFTKSSMDEDRIRDTFSDDEVEKYFKIVKGPMQLTEEAVNNPAIRERLVDFIKSLRSEFEGVNLVRYDKQIVPTDNLLHDVVMSNDEDKDRLESKFDQAGLKRTKVTLSGR